MLLSAIHYSSRDFSVTFRSGRRPEASSVKVSGRHGMAEEGREERYGGVMKKEIEKKIGKVTKKGFGVVLLRLIFKTPATRLRNTHMRHASLPVRKNRVQIYLFSFTSLSFIVLLAFSSFPPLPEGYLTATHT